MKGGVEDPVHHGFRAGFIVTAAPGKGRAAAVIGIRPDNFLRTGVDQGKCRYSPITDRVVGRVIDHYRGWDVHPAGNRFAVGRCNVEWRLVIFRFGGGISFAVFVIPAVRPNGDLKNEIDVVGKFVRYQGI